MFDPTEMAKHKGKITAYDSPIYIADAALYLMQTQPDLGITNPYELDEDQFNAAIDLLKQQNDYIGEYWSDYTKEIQAFTNGDSTVGTTWQVINQLLQADDQPVEAVLPEGGFDRLVGHLDDQLGGPASELHVHVDEPHHRARRRTPRWRSGSVRRRPTRRRATSPADPNHCKIYDADGKQYLDDLYYWTTPVADCGDDRGDVCKTYDDWVQAWTEVKG